MLTCAPSKYIKLDLTGNKTEEEEDVQMGQENHKFRNNFTIEISDYFT